MKARVLADFHDLQHDVQRKQGETFELSQARFAEIDAKLPGWLEKVEETAKRKAAPRKRTAAKKEPTER